MLFCANTPPWADYRQGLGQTGEWESACLVSCHPPEPFPCSPFVTLAISLSLPQAPSTQVGDPEPQGPPASSQHPRTILSQPERFGEGTHLIQKAILCPMVSRNSTGSGGLSKESLAAEQEVTRLQPKASPFLGTHNPSLTAVPEQHKLNRGKQL